MSTMAQVNQMYNPLLRKMWFDSDRIRAWDSADHLLIVETRFFTEHYTRLYWADVQSILLYGLNTHAAILRVLETVCVLGVIVPLVLWKQPWAYAAAALFVFVYGGWRFARPGWGCQVSTRTSAKQFAIPGTLVECRRTVEHLKNQTASAQAMLPEEQIIGQPPDGSSTPGSGVRQIRLWPRKPAFLAHVIAFVLGLLSPLSVVAFVAVFILYCLALGVAYFLQQDFRFPLAVRSATVMSQFLAVLQIMSWAFAKTHLVEMAPFSFEHWQIGLPRILISLYGIAAVYWSSIEQAKPEQKSSTVLGLS